MKISNRLSWLTVIIGIWQVFAPSVLGYVNLRVTYWNSIIFGAALILFGLWSALSRNPDADRNLDWINAIIGLWLLVSPFVLGYTTNGMALWNDVIVGIVVLFLEAWAALSVHVPVEQQSRMQQ